MADTPMDVDDTPAASSNAMAALMANAKGKGKATNGDGNGTMSEAEVKAFNEREGLPWSVFGAQASRAGVNQVNQADNL